MYNKHKTWVTFLRHSTFAEQFSVYGTGEKLRMDWCNWWQLFKMFLAYRNVEMFSVIFDSEPKSILLQKQSEHSF